MNNQKVTTEANQPGQSSLPALPQSRRRGSPSRLNRDNHGRTPWMICLRVLCMAVVALAFVTTAAPAMAADDITISVSTGTVGSTVLVRVTNAPGTEAWVSFRPDSTKMPEPRPSTVTLSITVTGGVGSEEFDIGLTPAGYYLFKADFCTKEVPFTVTPSIKLNQAGGLIGDIVEVWGNGFAAEKPVTVYLDDVKMTTSDTDALGSFPNAKFTFPPSASGKHTILVKDSEKNSIKATYTINPRVMLNPVSGCVGDSIQVSAAGFPAVSNVILSYDGVDLVTVPTDARGSVLTTLKIPPSGDALHKIKLTDGLNPVISNITVVPAMTINQTTGYVGQSVTMQGTGFRIGNALAATYDTVNLSGSTVGQDGSFNYTFSVPKSKAGPHNINITDGINNRSAAFTIESTPPPAPGLVAPSEGTRFTKDARFLWESVTDPSGVTYTIEIADDSRFSQPVISQANLSQTYLDVPDASKTLPGKSDGYYWRVRATDGAGNVGTWSVIGSFYKGVTVESVMSDMPSWTKFALIGVGLILFAFMVIFIRRNIMRVRYSDDEEEDEGYSDDEYGGELESGNKSKGYLN